MSPPRPLDRNNPLLLVERFQKPFRSSSFRQLLPDGSQVPDHAHRPEAQERGLVTLSALQKAAYRGKEMHPGRRHSPFRRSDESSRRAPAERAPRRGERSLQLGPIGGPHGRHNQSQGPT